MDKRSGRFVLVVAWLFTGLVCCPVDGDMVAVWDFDYDSAADAWSHHDGVIRGDACFAAGRPGAGRALELTGVEYVAIANAPAFDATGAITVAAWIKVHAFDKQWQAIVTKGNSSWRLQRNSETNAIEFACSGLEIPGGNEWGSLLGKRNVNDGQWHHVAGVYDGRKICLYVDGTLDVSQKASGKIATNDKPVCIGENSEQGNRCFNGLLDDVVIFNHALEAAQIGRLHAEGHASFLPRTMADRLVQEAEHVLTTAKAQDAVAALSAKISEYKQRQEGANDRGVYRDTCISPDVYFLLAQAREAASLPDSAVTAAYRQVIRQVPYRTHHVVDALLWLSRRLSADEYGQAVREFAGGSRVLSYDVRRAAGRFAEQGDWTSFERFLDALFSGMDPKQQSTYSCLSAAWVALQGNEPWAGRFLEYCLSQRELAPYLFRQQEKRAAKYVEQNDHQKAAEVYRAIATQCGPHETRMPYEYKTCECIFHADRHADALQALEAFIDQYGRHDGAPISSAMMLKGRCHVNLSQVDDAIDTFCDLLIRYPHSASAAEANFLMGYCLIIQGRFQDATEALKLVVQDYPQSEYAAKARLYLDRIETMAK